MSFSRPFAVAVIAALLATGHARAEETASTEKATTMQETVVHGTPPAGLAGRWLAVGWLERGGAITAFWQIGEQDGKVVLTQRFGGLPEPARKGFDAAGAEGRAWVPSADDLAALRNGWETLPTDDASYRSVWTEIASPDGFDDNLRKEARTKDARWVVRQRFDATPSAAPIIRQVFVYAVNGAEGDGYTGSLDGVMVASAPMAMPIPFKGTFRFYRLDPPPPPRGFVARVLDAFRGCRR